MTFCKTLAKYYEKWYRDSYDSIAYCKERGLLDESKKYEKFVTEYFDLINEYWYEIDFFRLGDSAFYNAFGLAKEFEKYNKINPNVFPSKKEFIEKWTSQK